jgi:hypothetical protein
MALSFQSIDLILRRGFSGTKAPHTLDAELSTLRDAEFVGSNVVAKRPGYSSVSLGSTAVSGAFSFVQQFGGGLLGVGEDTASGPMLAEVYADGTKAALNTLASYVHTSTSRTVATFATDRQRTSDTVWCDAAVLGDRLCVVLNHYDVAGVAGGYYGVFDTTTESWVKFPVQVGTTYGTVQAMKVVALSDRFLVLWQTSGGSLMTLAVDNSGTALTLEIRTTSGASAAVYSLDAAKRSGSDTAFVAVANSAGGTTTHEVTNAGVSSASVAWARSPAAGLHVFQFSGGNVGVANHDATDLRVQTYTSALVLVGTTGALTGIGAVSECPIKSIPSTSDATQQEVYASADTTTRYQAVSAAAAAGGAGILGEGISLLGNPFSFRGEVVLPVGVRTANDISALGSFQHALVVKNTSTFSTTYRISLAAVWGAGAGRTPHRLQPNYVAVGSDWFCPVLEDRDFTLVKLSPDAGNIVTTGAGVFAAGSCPQFFDAVGAAEAGFVAPPYCTTAPAAGGVGGCGAGSYSIILTYEWRDSTGRTWRSPASEPYSVTTTAGQQITLTAARLRATAKAGVRIIVYRTAVNGTVYYRDTSATNDSTTWGAAITAGIVTDAVLTTREIIYTAGGVLDSEVFPACRHLAEHKGRLVASGLLDSSRVAYSKTLAEGEGVGFSSEYQVLDVPKSDGRVVATASMDDKLVILAEKRPYVLTGEGPNDTGADNSFFLHPVQEAVQADWAYPRSVLASSLGVWYKSERGMRCLGRNLSLLRQEDGQFAGAETDALVTACVASVAHPTRPQLWFFVGSGAVAVYDYQWGQWSEFSNFACTHACTYGDTIAFCTSSGTVFQTVTGLFHDNSAAITAIIETGWLSMANIHGFQRIRRAFFTATDIDGGGGNIKFEFAYDGSATYSTADAPTLGSAMGSDVLTYRHHLARQKCSSIRLKLTLQGSTAGVDLPGGFRVTALGLEVGKKYGGPKPLSGQNL